VYMHGTFDQWMFDVVFVAVRQSLQQWNATFNVQRMASKNSERWLVQDGHRHQVLPQ